MPRYHLAVSSMGNVRWAQGQCQGNGPQELWLWQDEPWPVTGEKPLGKAWPVQQLPGTIPGWSGQGEDAPCPHFCFSKGTGKKGCVIRAVSWTCQGWSLVYLGTVAAFQPVVFLV